MSNEAATSTVRYAGFWRRVVASLLDALVLMIVMGVVGGLLGGIVVRMVVHSSDKAAGGPPPALFGAIGLLYVAAFVGWWLYHALMESSGSQATVGKLALGIKVTDLDGQRIGFGRATGRFFGKIISSFILNIGYLMAAFTARKQGLHDIMADCLVVRK